MRRSLFAFLLLATAAPAAAQATVSLATDSSETSPVAAAPSEPPVVPATREQEKSLASWIKKARSWQEWDRTWRGVPEWTRTGLAARRHEPEPPPWMTQACDDFTAGTVTATPQLVEACALQREIARDYAAMLADQFDQTRQWYRTQHENTNKSSFLSKLHVDGPYLGGQSGDMHLFSYAGVHVTMFDVKKRMFIWLPPGVSIVSMSGRGSQKLTPAYGMGVSFRWFNFHFPGASDSSSIYFNVSEFFVPAAGLPGVDNKVTMIGLSFTRQTPR
jgi:hypothetical protein